MTSEDNLKNIRRDYGGSRLCKTNSAESPFEQFALWFEEIEKIVKDPTAMVLSTVSQIAKPSSRIVLLKEYDQNGFAFFSNYNSKKANDIDKNEFASLLFYWDVADRQIRIEGKIVKTSNLKSEKYFESRPEGSRIAAIISPQSKEIEDRVSLDADFKAFKKEEITRPDYWGGYRLIPEYFEFWQGQENRLHDRIIYELKEGEWAKKRLAP